MKNTQKHDSVSVLFQTSAALMHRTLHFFRSFFTAHMLLIAIVTASSVGMVSCKKDKAATTDVPSAEEQMIARAKADLQKLLTDESMTLEEKENKLAQIKALNIQDTEVQSLIAQVEEKLKAARAERERLAEAERKRKAEEEARAREFNSPQNQLKRFLGGIGSASSDGDANQQIQQALGLFSSPDVPVLIVISEVAGQKDYDRPTTIKKYLEYLKDQKKAPEAIENIVFDQATGKIKELELTKLK